MWGRISPLRREKRELGYLVLSISYALQTRLGSRRCFVRRNGSFYPTILLKVVPTFLVVFVYKNGRHLNGYIAYCGPGRTLQSLLPYRCAMLPGTVLSAYATGGAENMNGQWCGVIIALCVCAVCTYVFVRCVDTSRAYNILKRYVR